uniref:Macaca fascicularis brain cDNA clone: QflA-17925, similar to human cAMP responsive element binding protein-like 2 (CREBL2), mRNA, RefSeq: NM_001310.2 n=1 Tax=Macaca fascicularis TaxID=9541 RepID=I7GMQ7_MACFA|nr:unnamed protein product [Macaca fascicularis]
MTRRLTVTESRRRCCSPCFLSKQSNVFFFLFSQGKKGGKYICMFRPVKFCHYFIFNLLYIRAAEYNME